ncbi:hypothetical protein IX51_07850 [uncultured archaeon]|nr:hypothetical protein IX51_07850 [uncultured archaeon]
MPTPDLNNLVSFIPQYIIATLVALYVFSNLRRRRFYSKPEFSLIQFRNPLHSHFELIGMSFFSSLEKVIARITTMNIIHSAGSLSSDLPGSDLRSGFIKSSSLYSSAEYVRKNRFAFKAPSSRVKFPELFYRRGIYDAYSALFAIAVWAGVLLLLTPYQKIFIFIPHFASLTVNLTIIIVLSITIFEGTIASLFLFIGTSRKRVSLVMLTVMGVFSLSLLTPSFNWFHVYTYSGEVMIYSVLGILILSITFLISLFKDKGILFKLAFYSSVVSYAFFIAVTAYNILLTILGGL